MCGGAFVSDDLRVRLQNFLIKGHVVVAFGMTELGGLPIVSLPDVKLGTTGSLCPMVQVIVIDDDGNRIKPLENGEICFKLPFKFLGYLGNIETPNDNEWYRTGDIGYFDKNTDFHIIRYVYLILIIKMRKNIQ